MIPFTTIISQCAPEVSPVTMSAIVHVESGGKPLAMYDNTTGQTFQAANVHQAVAWLRNALAHGQKVDVGIAQVDSENFRQYGLNPVTAFNVCDNLSVGAKILASDYKAATLRYGAGQTALYHAFQAYNSGHLIGDTGYANKVLAAAGIPVAIEGNQFVSARRSHFHNPFSYRWTTTNQTIAVDVRYQKNSSGLSSTYKWG